MSRNKHLNLRRNQRIFYPHTIPNYKNRKSNFENLVKLAIDDFMFALNSKMEHVAISVEEIPNFRDLKLSEITVPLGRLDRGNPEHVILYRRPIEIRCTNDLQLDRKIRDVLAELIGSIIGLRPIDIDPDYAGTNN